MTTGGALTFVGRAGELERLRACVSALAAGAGAVVVLEGDAGAGKTRLIEELQPAVVAGALEYVNAPYAPVRDLLVALDRRAPKVLARDAALRDALRPVLDLNPPSDELPEQRKILDAAAEALRKYGEAEPLIVAVEDVHWIDRGSAEIVAHLARQAARMRVLLIITYRAADAMDRDESRGLVAQLTRLARVVLPLKPLSTSESMLLINEAASDDLPLAVRRSICELAQGNPLLLLELTRHAQQSPGALGSQLPVSLQALVHDRLARFSEGERDVLRVCAAMETFEPGDVAEIAGVAPEIVTGTLRKARSEHIIAESAGRFVFRHALIRRAVNDEVLGIELASLHARIAVRLKDRPDSPDLRARLAFHYWLAGETEESQRYNALAAKDAVRVRAYDDAAMLYERSIGTRELDETTFETYRQLATAYEAAGRYRQAVDVFRKCVAYAFDALPADEAARLSIDLSRVSFHALDDEGSIAAVREAIRRIDGGAHRALAFDLHSLLGWYLVHLRRVDEAKAALDAAAEFLDAAETLALIRYHEARAAYQVHACGGEDWRTHIDRALDLADTLDDAGRLRRYTNAIALAVASVLDDYPFALSLHERVEQVLAKSAGSDLGAAFQSAMMTAQYRTGRLREARKSIDVLLPYIADTPMFAFRVAAVGVPLALRTGDEHLLRACAVPRLLQDAFASNDPVVFGPLAAAVAEHMLSQNRAGEALALVERTIKRLNDAGNNFHLILLAARVGSENCVRRAIELLLPWTERSRSARAVMLLIRAYRSASGKERVALAREAAARFSDLDWPLHAAQAFELAGDIEAAAELYDRTGAAAEVARLEVRRRAASPLSGKLSKREIEVAHLVAEGKSNRSIAGELSLSERTVENHIGSIFAKLNMRSRSEIASYVARETAHTA